MTRRWEAANAASARQGRHEMGIPTCAAPLRRGTFPQSAAQELLEEMHGAFRKKSLFAGSAKGDPWRAGRLAVLAVGVLLCAAGCGSGDSKTTHAVTKGHKAKAAAAQGTPGEQPLSEMVAAVSPAKGPPVELKFALPIRPEVGQVTEVDVALVPSQPVPDSVSISFQVVDGLEIVDGAQLERIEKLTAGTPIRHVLKVLPKRDGIFAITAIVSFSASNLESSRAFSIPVIAGVGMPDQVAKGP